jgi:hypothetical protein
VSETYDVGAPEPKPIDEELSVTAGEVITYCWHPNLRVLVGAEWWCQWWKETPQS